MKEFNTTGVCIPSKHYMVDLTERVNEIKKMVDAGKYFTINRARQYGKTTTLAALEKRLSDDYYVVSIDFQDYGNDSFSDADSFCRDYSTDFCSILKDKIDQKNDELMATINALAEMSEDTEQSLRLFTMFKCLNKICSTSDRPIVLLIDEVDSATNNQLFIDFLAALRSGYLKREKNDDYKTFQSVILSGVTDIKHLKSKLRDEDQSKVNSPWNIATDYQIDMSLSTDGIKGMLDDYECDHHTGMDTVSVATEIRDYTNGYPYLVSRICQLIDTRSSENPDITNAWTHQGIDTAVKTILSESNTLFQSLTGKLDNSPTLKESLHRLLMEGERIPYNLDQNDISQMHMYGFIRNENNVVKIDNRIFESRLYNYSFLMKI